MAFGFNALPPALRAPLSEVGEQLLANLPFVDDEYSALHSLGEGSRPSRIRAITGGRFSLFEGGRPSGISIPICAYLLDAPGGRFVVDAGLSSRWRDPGSAGEASPDHGGMGPGQQYGAVLDGESVSEQVRAASFNPQRLVCTHLHVDHVGGARELGLTLEAAAAELEAARSGRDGYPVQDLAGLETRAIQLDPGSPMGPFPATALLAEGILAVDTGGHTPGSISLLICLGNVWGLLCGDAVYPQMDDPASPAFTGMLRIRRLLQDMPGVMIMAGHDTGILRACANGAWLGTVQVDAQLHADD
ncbi:MAG: MBL fold metallo-hydrolase [Candidatus Dormibacteria bacterium]